MNRIPVTGSIIFLHWDERKKKRKIIKAREGGDEIISFFFSSGKNFLEKLQIRKFGLN